MRKIRLKVKSKSYKVCFVQTSWLPDGLSYSDLLLKRPSSSSSSSSSHLSLCFSVGLRAERVMTDASVFEPEPDWLWVPAHRQIKRLSIVYILNQDSWTVFKSVEFVSKSFKVMTHQKTHLRYQRTHPVLTKDCGLNSTISSNKSKNLPFFRGIRSKKNFTLSVEKVACKSRGGKWNALMKFWVSGGCKSRRCWPVY